MLNPEDRRAIEGLFVRLDKAERNAPDRDPEAEDLIRGEIARQPAAPYYMAQTILVQEHALAMAEQRIQDLEAEAKRGRGGLFGGLFDDGRSRNERSGQPARQPERGPWDRDEGAGRRGQGGGFLAGAAQTALGVSGGLLLGSAIGSLLGAGSAQAADAPPEAPPEPDAGGDDYGGDDFGGDGGGFDMGGDF